MSIAFIFPGQGSQAVGMGAELAKAYTPARAVFAEVDEALGQPLSALMWEGPEDQLTLTENAQPALMAVSLAVIRVLGEEKGIALDKHVAFVAGHSIGEYSAIPRASSRRGAAPCKPRCRWGRGPWRRCSGPSLPRRKNLPRRQVTARSAPQPTTM